MGLTTKGTIGAKIGADAGRGREARAGAGRRRQEGEAGHPGALPRRPDLRAGGRARTSSTHTKGIVGFFGASSIERLPTEVAITGCVKQFKGLGLRS